MPDASALADKLDSQREEIIARWLQNVEGHRLLAVPLPKPELINSLPEFLDEVAAALRRGGPTRGVEEQSPTTVVARVHGEQRYRHGFDLAMVVWEYSLLRDLLFDFMEESGLAYTMQDVRVLSYAVASGVAGAVEQYSRDREADMRASYTEVSRARDQERQLIGIVSHDLRNPLSAILMSAEVALRCEGLPEVAGRALRRLRVSAQRAVRLIGDLLDFTRERVSGQIPVKPEPADMAELVREAIEEAQFSFRTRTIEHDERGPLTGQWDPDRIIQMVSNLLTNALKFSPAGSVVTLTTEGSPHEITLTVHNDGPPIPAARLPTVFEPLQVVDPGSRASGSLGLGLHISRQIVRAHGGEIKVRSSAEAGTQFTVTLPREATVDSHNGREGEE